MHFSGSHFRPISLCLTLALTLAWLGCAQSARQETPATSTRPANVTTRATLFTTQSGDALFSIPSTGVFSVIDHKTDHCVFATPAMAGQRVFFAPTRNQIYLNNAVVYQGPLDPSRQYRFYFEKE